jgi:hypothetical protein
MWRYAQETPVATPIKLWKWKYIRNILRKHSSATDVQDLSWNHQGEHRGGTPRKSWRRTIRKQK